MRLEPWHIPLLAIAGIVIVECVVRKVARWRRRPHVPRQVVTVALAVMAAVMLVLLAIGVRTLGSSAAANLATFAAALAELVAVWLLFQSYRDQKAAQQRHSGGGGGGGPFPGSGDGPPPPDRSG